MLSGLGHDRFIRGYYQENAIDPSDTREHVFDEPLVAGDIHETDLNAIEFEVAEAEIDGDAAQLFLFQPIGINTGKGFHKRTLAVVDVPGGSYDQVAHTQYRLPLSSRKQKG
jgi:hypothetical protein